MRSAITFAAMLLGCSGNEASTREEGAVAHPGTSNRDDVDLKGRWRLVSIDGEAPAGKKAGDDQPSFRFDDYHFGGTVGCNQFGGLALLVDGRYAVHSLSGTAMGCPAELARQEQAVSQLFFARPHLQTVEPNRIRLKSDSHKIELERLGPAATPASGAGPEDLTGTSWRITTIDEDHFPNSQGARMIRFDEGKWQGSAACATLYGTWRLSGDRIISGDEIATTEQKCPEDLARFDDRLAALMKSSRLYLVGPNGELLIAGGGHALAGSRL